MKYRVKKGFRLSGKRGETMVEVLVAFVLLAIILVLFSQGIAWATRAEANASNSREAADSAMEALQHDIANGVPGESNPDARILVKDGVELIPYIYSKNGYKYVVYRAKEG
jgi:type II secretory pathway pseudopilin PulG